MDISNATLSDPTTISEQMRRPFYDDVAEPMRCGAVVAHERTVGGSGA